MKKIIIIILLFLSCNNIPVEYIEYKDLKGKIYKFDDNCGVEKLSIYSTIGNISSEDTSIFFEFNCNDNKIKLWNYSMEYIKIKFRKGN